MQLAERARQIDQEEFRRDSEQALQRALAYSKHKQDMRRRQFLAFAFPSTGDQLDLDRSYAPTDTQPHVPLAIYRIGMQAYTAGQWAHRLHISESTLVRGAHEYGSMEAVIKEYRRRTRPGRAATRHDLNGESLTRSQWAKRLGISCNTFDKRREKYGMATAVSMGARHQKGRAADLITHDGRTMTRQEWSDHLGLRYDSLTQRIYKHGIHHALAMGDRRKIGRRRSGAPARPADAVPGVVSDFARSIGTGGGRLLQETPEITFSEKAQLA